MLARFFGRSFFLLTLLTLSDSQIASAQTVNINRDSDLERAEALMNTLKTQCDRTAESLDKIQVLTGKKPVALKRNLVWYLETPIVKAEELGKITWAAPGTTFRNQVNSLGDLASKMHNEPAALPGTRNERVRNLLTTFLESYNMSQLCQSWPDGRVSDFYPTFCR